MSIFEDALAGKHGEEAQHAAEGAVRSAVDKMADMFKHAGPMIGGTISSFPTGGLFSVSAAKFTLSNGEAVLPLSVNEEVRKRALSSGHTELRFNSETMGYAYHKPDQAVGEDGRVYVRKGK